MKKSVLFLAFLLIASLGGCNRDEDLVDTLTSGTWSVGSFFEDNDEHTSLFHKYVFTFLADGSVTVARAGTPPPPGTWDEDNSGRILELDFGNGEPLEKLNEDWVVDRFTDDEVFMHVNLTLLRLDKR